MNVFEVSKTPLIPDVLKEGLRTESAGAFVCFEGWVRNHNEGRPVGALSYEGFEEMICAEGERILSEAVERFGIEQVRGVHRLGDLALGDLAVWVGVCSGHRAEAFAAAAWVLEELKARLPIWKKEAYKDHPDTQWVGIREADHALNTQRYARQVKLPELGEDGQAHLASSTVLVLGAGGLGCPALQYLAAAGVGTIRIVDGDNVSLDNLQRQILYGERDLGMKKAQAARRRLLDLNPSIRIEAVPEFATAETLPALLEGVEVALDGSDNFATRYLMHDVCWEKEIPLIQGAVHQWEGQLNVFHAGNGGGCLRCLWPEEPQAGCVGGCADTGILGVTTGTVGVRMATETIRLLLKIPGGVGADTLLMDTLSGNEQRLTRSPRPDCSCQREAKHISTPDDILHPASGNVDRIRTALWLDLREPEERIEDPHFLEKFHHAPLSGGLPDPKSLPGEGEVLLVCASGGRAQQTRERLRQGGCSRDLLVWAAPISSLRSYI